MNVEGFFGAHQHTISAVEAAGTVTAVVVALVVAFVSQRASRTQIRARVAVTVIMHEAIEPPNFPEYVTVDITNRGIMPAMIPLSFFYWRRPLSRGWLMVQPMDYSAEDEWVPQKRYPVDISPRSTKSFFLSKIETFRVEMQKSVIGESLLNRCRLRFLRAYVRADDGKMFKVKIDRSVRDELTRLWRLRRDKH